MDGTETERIGGIVLGGDPEATVSAQSTDPADALSFRCWYVEDIQKIDATMCRVDFTDGSYVESGGPTLYDVIGSPGRVVERISFPDENIVVENPDTDCDPGRKATTFTAGSVTIGEYDVTRPTPTVMAQTDVVLRFADGSSQVVLTHSEHTDVGYIGGHEGLSTTYRGEGEHESKVIEAVEFSFPFLSTTVHLRNEDVGAHLLGTATPQERVVEVVGATEGEVHYEFTVDGTVEPIGLTDRIGAGGNDAVTDNGDGTQTVDGFTGNTGYGDAYVVNGEITSFAQTGGDGEYVVRETERRVTRRSFDDPDLVRVVGEEAGDVHYEFTVDGAVYPVTNVGQPLTAEDSDVVTDNGDGTWTVDGFTGNTGYGDTYVLAGDVTSFNRTGGNADFRIEVNGRDVSPAELVDDY